MKNNLVDLHIHSYYSDGTMSPMEILEEALKNGVGYLAITDHDVLEGSLELQRLSRDYDIQYIPGVELDSLMNGLQYHILGYGVDMEDENFRSFVKYNRAQLDQVNTLLIERMQKDFDCITLPDYMNYSYDRSKGGWKALHYLIEKGITQSLREGFAWYPKYGCTYDCVHFPTIETVCDEIHKAGGKAVLAHPGVSVKEDNIEEFERVLTQLLNYEIDGIECYYPTHSDKITEICLKLCTERDLLITTGSDCHGTFGNANIGEMNISIDKSNLGTLVFPK